MLLGEVSGGLEPHAEAYLYSLDAQATTRGARDDTVYHDPPGSRRLKYLEHHSRAISGAMMFGNAIRVHRRIGRSVLRPTPPARWRTGQTQAHAPSTGAATMATPRLHVGTPILPPPRDRPRALLTTDLVSHAHVNNMLPVHLHVVTPTCGSAGSAGPSAH